MTSSFWMMSNFRNIKKGEIYAKLREDFYSKHIKKLGSNNKKRVNVFDKDGQLHKVSIEDPRYISGEFTFQFKKTVVVINKEGHKMRMSIEDPRYISGEFVGHTKGMSYAVDLNGVSHYVNTSDIRFSTGELKGNNADTIYINNGVRNRRIPNTEIIPEGWYKGMLKKSNKGFIWVNNGEITKMVLEDDIPVGFVKGRLKI